jgi:hypothetical protein
MSITKQLRGWCVPFATFISTFAVFGTQNAFSAAVTYTFSQSGWTDGAGDVGTLTGSFTGTPEANGTIQLGDLTSFLASFHETVANVPNTFNFNAPAAFSFDTNSPSSLEFSAGSAASNIQICSGSTDTQQICLGISPTSGAASPDVGYFFDLPNFGPSQTRIAAIVSPVSQPGTAPEPASVALVGGPAVLLIARQIRQRPKRQRREA